MQSLKNENVNMQKQITRALIHANDNEQYGRKNSVRIYGIAISNDPRNENCKKLVSSLLTNQLGLDIEEGDMNAAHRIGQIREGKQPIIVKFFARDTKTHIMENRFKLKGNPIRIYDDLTVQNRRLLNRLKITKM